MSRFLLPYQRANDNNGAVLPGSKLIFTISGTSTAKNTYSDLALTTPNANPVVADSQGQFGDIFLASGLYRVELTDEDDVTQPGYPEDNISETVLPTGAQTIDGKAFTGTTKLGMAGIINASKGADVPSEAALFTTSGFPTDGNYFDVTGTTAITSIITSSATGTTIKLHFDGVLTLTHNATDLFLPSEANITTAAGDEAEFIEYQSGDWRCTNYERVAGTALVAGAAGAVVQMVNFQTGAEVQTTNQIPFDNTIPQITEGGEMMTKAVTPSNASNNLKIDIVWIGQANAGDDITIALFQDTTVNALATACTTGINGGDAKTVTFSHYMTSGTTSPTTFRIRAGANTAGNTAMNTVGGSARMGGTLASSITITEIQA